MKKKKKEWQKITTATYLKEHLVILPDMNKWSTYQFRIKGRDIKGNKLVSQVREFTPAKISEMKNDKSGPEISDVHVEEIKKGVFYEAFIFWQTNIPSTSQVIYGTDNQYNNESVLDIALVKNHRVSLYELDEGGVYQFRVKSSDIYGNSTVSPSYTLKVTELFPRKTHSQKSTPSPLTILGKIALLRVEPSRVIVSWETSSATDSVLEWQEIRKKKIITRKKARDKGKHGLGLRSDRETGIDACYGCHPPEVLGLSHPVGVYPKQNIEIPEDLPTAEGGMLTCVTCHYPHGSNQRYLARRKVQQDLCKSCHGK